MKVIRRHLLTAYAIAAFAYLLVPIAIVIAFSFNDPAGRYNYTWQGFTLRQWQNWDGVPGLKDAMVLSLESIDKRLIEAAEDLYASSVQAFLRVTLPLSLPGVVAGTLLTFIPATGDFINAQLLGTPNQAMIGNVIQSKFFNLLDYPGAAALSFTLMAAVLILIAVYAKVIGTEKLTG